MNNTTRNRTKEGRDTDNPAGQTIPQPQAPQPDDSAHVPDGATELAEITRALQPPMGEEGRSDKKL